MKRKITYSLLLLAVLAGAFGAFKWLKSGASETKQYRTAKIERGNLVQTVRATGIIQPVKLVQVGTQVNGPVTKLYVDFNSLVKEGDLVAQIDPIVYEAQLARDEASLKQSLANVEQIKARLAQADSELLASNELDKKQMISRTDLLASQTDKATLAAQLKVAEAAVEQSKAALRLSKANLDYTTIRSPVDGVVISRNVSEGQTVVASMSAQVLFQIATDLKQVQVEASIPEADVGRLQLDQPVTFTVDAFDQKFKGKVSMIRMAASTVQNVVTYPVIIAAANVDGRLFPGMTANVICEVARKTGVLKVPNAALRFKPANASNETRRERPANGEESAPKSKPKIWVLDDGAKDPVPVNVTIGISDGTATEVEAVEGTLEGRNVVTGIADNASKDQATVNPFTPKMPGPSRPAGR